MSILTDNRSRNVRRAAAGPTRCGGWLLPEMMVAVGVGLTFLAALVVIFVTCSISFAEVGNYINMDQHSRNALDHMTRNIRSAKQLTSFAPAVLVFNYDSAGTTNLTYRYNSSSGVLTEEWTVGGATTTQALLTSCNSLAFSLYDHDLAPTTDVSAGEGKVIGVAWNCSGTALNRTNTEYMQQAQIVVRNQP